MTREEIKRDILEVRSARATRRTLEKTLASYNKRIDRLSLQNNSVKEAERLRKITGEIEAKIKKLRERETAFIKKHEFAIERLPVIAQMVVKQYIDCITYEEIGRNMGYSKSWARWKFESAVLKMSEIKNTDEN